MCVLVLCLLSAYWSPAFARGNVPGTPGTGTYYTDTHTSTHYPSASAACNGDIAWISASGTQHNNDGTVTGVHLNFLSGLQCAWLRGDGGGDYDILGVGNGAIVTCPANSSDAGDGSSCVCGDAFQPGGPGATICVPLCGAAGSSNSSLGGGSYKYNGDPRNLCAPDGCVVTASVTATDSNGFYASGPFSNTGQTCAAVSTAANQAGTPASAPTAPTQDPGQQNCSGANMCGGTFNGQFICAKCGTASNAPVTSTTTTTDTPAGGSPGAPSTTTTTSQTVDNPDGTSTTTTTITKGDGSSTTSSSSCTTTAKDCKGATDGDQKDSFGGSCTTPFTCTGDAIQCSITQEMHQRACLMYQPETQGGAWAHGAATLSQAKADGDIPSWSPSHPTNAVVSNFDWSTTIDHSASLSAACPADIPIGSSGRVLPLAWLCPYLGTIGMMIEAFASVVCLLILFKGK